MCPARDTSLYLGERRRERGSGDSPLGGFSSNLAQYTVALGKFSEYDVILTHISLLAHSLVLMMRQFGPNFGGSGKL